VDKCEQKEMAPTQTWLMKRLGRGPVLGGRSDFMPTKQEAYELSWKLRDYIAAKSALPRSSGLPMKRGLAGKFRDFPASGMRKENASGRVLSPDNQPARSLGMFRSGA
jgi:hypothetical protein